MAAARMASAGTTTSPSAAGQGKDGLLAQGNDTKNLKLNGGVDLPEALTHDTSATLPEPSPLEAFRAPSIPTQEWSDWAGQCLKDLKKLIDFLTSQLEINNARLAAQAEKEAQRSHTCVDLEDDTGQDEYLAASGKSVSQKK